MTDYQMKLIEAKFKRFSSRNLEPPARCRNLEQTRYYIKELCTLIASYQTEHGYVPLEMYSLLTRYNDRQNALLRDDFIETYC